MTLRRTYCAVGVFVAALLLYLPALGNEFAYDDVPIVQGDPRVHSLDHIDEIFGRGYWADAEQALYRPITTLSFAVDWAISGGDAAWFLFMNAVWNAAAAVLVFLLLAHFAPIAAALAGALLFAAHPVHVEAVANTVGRAEPIAAVFMLAAILAWPRPGGQHIRTALTAVLFAAALLTKESAIMLPALLVLVDAARGDLVRHEFRHWLRARALPFALLAAVAVAYLGIRAAVLGGITPARLDAALEVTTGGGRLLTALQAWPHYMRLLLVPVVLLADYGPRIIMPAEGVTPRALAGAAIIAMLVIGGVVSWWRGHGGWALALLWFPVAILPVSNLLIPIGIIVAERTLYLPSLALAIAVALALPAIAHRVGARVPAIALAVVIALFAVRTVIRIPEWRTTNTIFAALLRDRPDSFRAHWHHARLDAAAGNHEAALRKYVQALELWPFRERLVLEAVRAAIRAQNPVYARDLAAYAEVHWPRNPDAARLHAAITLDMGDTTAARGVIVNARRRFPEDTILKQMDEATR